MTERGGSGRFKRRSVAGVTFLAMNFFLVLVNLALLARNLSSPRPAMPNVLLIIIDSLRADQLSCLGNREHRTESIDWLAEQGVLFERHYAQNGYSVQAHLSMMTGHYVSELLSAEEPYPTMAELFRARLPHGRHAFEINARSGAHHDAAAPAAPGTGVR